MEWGRIVSGAVDRKNQPGAIVQVRPYSYDVRLSGQAKRRQGRGTTSVWAEFRWLWSQGTGAGYGKAEPGGWFLPETFQPTAASLVIAVMLPRTGEQHKITLPILITAINFKREENKGDWPTVYFTYNLTGPPVMEGFDGEQPDFAAASKSDQQQWAGTTFDHDTGNLTSSAIVAVDLWGNMTNSDAANYTRLTDLIAAATIPFTGMKLRHATFQQDSIDGATAFKYFGLTTSDEDVINEHESKVVDPQLLADRQTKAKWNGTPDLPDDPGLVLRETITREYNDGMILQQRNWANSNHSEDLTFPASPRDDDQSDLYDEEQIAITDDSTPVAPNTPTGMKLVSIRRVQLTDDGRYFWVYSYKRRTNEEAVEFDGSPYSYDASSLADAYTATSVEADGVYNPPAAISGYVIVNSLIVQVHNASTGAKWIHRYNYGRVNNENRIEFEGMTITKPASASEVSSGVSVEGTSRLRVISTNSNPAAVAPTPSDYGLAGKIIWYSSQQLTTTQGTYTGRWMHDYVIGANSGYDEIINQGVYEDDPSSLGNRYVEMVVDNGSTIPGDPSPPSEAPDLKIVARTRRRTQETPPRYVFGFVFGRNNHEDELEHPSYTIDNDNIGETEHHKVLHTSETVSPGTPLQKGTASKLVNVQVSRVCVPSGSFLGFWLWEFFFGPNTRLDELLRQGVFVNDVSDIGDTDVQYRVTDNSTPPATPSPLITDLKLVRTTGRQFQTTPEKWLWRFEFARNTVEDELEHERYNIDTDDLDEIEHHQVVHTSPTSPPTPPNQRGTTTQIINLEVQRICDDNGSFLGVWLWSYTFGPNTRKQLIQQQGEIDRELSGLSGRDFQIKVGNSSTPESDPSVRISGMQIVRRISIQIQNTPEKWKHYYIFAWLTEEEEIEHRGTSDGADISGSRVVSGVLDREALVDTCLSTDTADSLMGALETSLNADTVKGWLAADVVKLNKTHFLKRIQRPGDDKKIILGPAQAGEEEAGVDGSGVYVKVAWAIPYGTGQKLYTLKHFKVWRVRQRIGLVRYYRASTLSSVQFRSLQGTVDNAGFLGHPALTMAYLFTETDANWAQEGASRWVRVVHWFLYDNLNHVTPDGVPLYKELVDNANVALTGNLVAWSTLSPNPGGSSSLAFQPTPNGTYNASFLA